MEVCSEALMRGRVKDLMYDVSILTNITSEHLNIHGTLENYIKDKWPNISVKSMETDKLKELFYHYIPNIDLSVKEKIDKSSNREYRKNN